MNAARSSVEGPAGRQPRSSSLVMVFQLFSDLHNLVIKLFYWIALSLNCSVFGSVATPPSAVRWIALRDGHSKFKRHLQSSSTLYLPNAFWKRTMASSTLARLPKAETRTKPSPAEVAWARFQGLVTVDAVMIGRY
jgi:hypothetical protein